MKRVLLAIISGAVIAFTWGFISWMFVGWHTHNSFHDPAEVAEVISANAPTDGIYMLPMENNEMDQAAAMTKGPFIYAHIRSGSLPKPWSMTKTLLISFTNNALCSLIIAICVLRIRATRYISRASVGATLGIFAAMSTVLPRWTWFETPDMHLIAEMLDPIIAYTLAGLAIASIIKAPKARRIFS